MIERIKADVLGGFCAVHVDESPWPIAGLKRKTHMWVVSNSLGAYYRFEPTRSGKVASEELLYGYQGSANSDAYGGYNRVNFLQSNVKLDPSMSFGRYARTNRRTK